jgi:hypothetical protein
MESWLVLSNCQTYELANSLKLLSSRFHIDAIDIWAFTKNIEKYKEELPRYFRVLIHPRFSNMDFDFSIAQNLDFIPSISFDAYHPDICYAFSNGPVQGPMGFYHSMIVLAAYEAGLSVEVTRKLFRRDVFERCGFFGRWEQERTQLLKHFAEYGLDIAPCFAQWSRGEAFMYSVNHPKIRCIYDIAGSFLKRLGVEAIASGIKPVDDFLNGACYPVYPEIAEAFGTQGSYLFKLPDEYRLISLERFIELSFAAYSRFLPRSIQVELAFRGRYDHVKTVVAGAVQ